METLVPPLILGLVQGLTEFLPVSSSGHLHIVREWLHWPDTGLPFDVVLHLGTFLATLVFFRSTISALLRGRERPLLRALILGTIPAALVGALGAPFIEQRLRGAELVGSMFIVTGLVLGGAELIATRRRPAHSLWTAPRVLAVGLAQVFALVPGLSRSGLTIATGLAVGWPRAQAVEFSFLLSLPITAAAGLRGLWQMGVLSLAELAPVGVGALTAFLAGLAALTFVWHSLQRGTLWPYVLYLLAIGTVTLLR